MRNTSFVLPGSLPRSSEFRVARLQAQVSFSSEASVVALATKAELEPQALSSVYLGFEV